MEDSGTEPASIKESEEPESTDEANPTASKKQIPLRKKKAKSDPLLDPDIEIAFHDTPKLKPKSAKEIAPQEPAETTDRKKRLDLKPKSESTNSGSSEALETTPETLTQADAPEAELSPETNLDSGEVKPSGLSLKETPESTKEVPANEELPPKLTPRVVKAPKVEKTSSGRKSLVVAVLAILILTLMAGGAVILIMGGLSEEVSPPNIVRSDPLEKTPPTPNPKPAESKASTGPVAAIQKATEAVNAVNAINQNLEQQLEPEATSQTLAQDPLAEDTEKTPLRVVSVPTQTIATKRTVIEVKKEEQTAANPSAENAEPIDPSIQRAQLAQSIEKDPKVSAWVKDLQIPSHSETMQKITTGKAVYGKGDLVDEDLQLSLYHVTSKIVYFEDARGAIYAKPMR